MRGVACREVNLSLRTWRRRQKRPEEGRSTAVRLAPLNRLSSGGRGADTGHLSSAGICKSAPSQIVPCLADKGIYLASESTFYWILRRYDEVHHRGQKRRAEPVTQPRTYTATGTRQVWTWDITWPPSVVRGRWYYLYLTQDLLSRKITGAEGCETESGEQAVALMYRTVLWERCWRNPLALHADNGAAMKSQTLQVKLSELKTTPSHSRPGVSNKIIMRTLSRCS